jgi:DNA-binding Lrp family transcriptional regulator
MSAKQSLDRIDLKILFELQLDGRVRNNDLASRVGVSPTPCLRRVRSLRARGFIQTIRATLNERLLGYEVASFVLIRLKSQAQVSVQTFEATILAHPLVLQCWRISGDADFLLKCVARGVEAMREQLLQFSAMPDVEMIKSLPVLGKSKDEPLPTLRTL